jgi:hypothetical protein
MACMFSLNMQSSKIEKKSQHTNTTEIADENSISTCFTFINNNKGNQKEIRKFSLINRPASCSMLPIRYSRSVAI